ncbi:hypothetical protein ACLD0W_03685 [Alloalcanivorax sp. C16-1]|uniref:hypothetical protein n=1 Tax=Alloalcanivorax sp. C16-1 TaxID=3390051 RepID=UPI0039711087
MAAKKKVPQKNKIAAKKVASKAKAKSSGKGKAWTFPKNSLEESLRVARAIEDKNAGNPMRAADLGRALGFNRPADWRFQDLLKSSNQYGLTSGSGANATVELDSIGEDIVAPSSSGQRQQALVNAFRNVEEFRKVEDFYGGKRLPEDEFFENTLVRDFSIPRDRVRTFIDVFTSNLKYIKPFAGLSSESESSVPESIDGADNNSGKTIAPKAKENERIRQFLDTCFVMMPFGEWFNRYYQEIYVPAIREAGFEPVRGDELFTTGSVVEQIWEQVAKSPVLLADLTGKNANVFYELGLAHAARKPVVFTASNIEDVPFDLRHLRVIVYDIREPNWAEKLSNEVTEYLKNAKIEPEKSIPQPFRDFQNGEE